MYRSGLTAAVYAVRIVCRPTHLKYVQSVKRDMYNANVYCRQIHAVYDNGQTGTVVRDDSPRNTFQNIDRWTTEQTDRPTDQQTVSHNVAVLDFTRS